MSSCVPAHYVNVGYVSGHDPGPCRVGFVLGRPLGGQLTLLRLGRRQLFEAELHLGLGTLGRVGGPKERIRLKLVSQKPRLFYGALPLPPQFRLH